MVLPLGKVPERVWDGRVPSVTFTSVASLPFGSSRMLTLAMVALIQVTVTLSAPLRAMGLFRVATMVPAASFAVRVHTLVSARPIRGTISDAFCPDDTVKMVFPSKRGSPMTRLLIVPV